MTDKAKISFKQSNAKLLEMLEKYSQTFFFSTDLPIPIHYGPFIYLLIHSWHDCVDTRAAVQQQNQEFFWRQIL